MFDNVYLDFIKEYLNIEIEYEITRTNITDYVQALNLAISGETLPDVVFWQSNATEANAIMNEMVESELCYDITEVYELYASDEVKNRFDSWGDTCFSNVTFDGKLMGLQRNDRGVGEWDLVHIRQDWLDKLGIELDKDGNYLITMDELEMVIEAFVTQDPGESGNPVGMFIGNFTAKSSNYSQNLISNAFGAPVAYWYLDENGNVVDGSIVPEVKEAWAWYADLYEKGYLDPQVGVTDLAMAKSMFINGQLGSTTGSYNLPN